MTTEQIAILTSIIGVCGTVLGTILGWFLQLVKRKKLIFSKISIPLSQPQNDICNDIFTIDVYNTSQKTRAIRDPIIVFFDKGREILKEQIQLTRLYINQKEREKSEKYLSDDNKLIEIPPYGSISQKCKIEFYNDFDLKQKTIKVFIKYKDEYFRSKSIKKISLNI